MTKVIDETGNVYSRLTVIRRDRNRRDQACWWCVCSCGEVKSIIGTSLRNGTVKSCGCLKKEMHAKIIGGKKHV